MQEYSEIFKLKEMLQKEGIPFSFSALHGGWHLEYYLLHQERCICSIVEHYYSYGNQYDTLEIRGLLTPDELQLGSVVGYLSAEEVFRRIKEHWINQRDC